MENLIITVLNSKGDTLARAMYDASGYSKKALQRVRDVTDALVDNSMDGHSEIRRALLALRESGAELDDKKEFEAALAGMTEQEQEEEKLNIHLGCGMNGFISVTDKHKEAEEHWGDRHAVIWLRGEYNEEDRIAYSTLFDCFDNELYEDDDPSELPEWTFMTTEPVADFWKAHEQLVEDMDFGYGAVYDPHSCHVYKFV